jgi:hypothetical protein
MEEGPPKLDYAPPPPDRRHPLWVDLVFAFAIILLVLAIVLPMAMKA